MNKIVGYQSKLKKSKIRHYLSDNKRLYRKDFSRSDVLKSFYKDKVCLCPGGTRDDGAIFRFPGTHMQYEYYVKYGQDVQVCNDCGKLEVERTYKCKECDTLFYHLFLHPKYHWAAPTCWHCLQELHYSKSALEPPISLLPPKSKIKTLADTMEEARALLANRTR